ncbi:MAG: Holliday junction resolvase RuvX, partial [Oscillospiraceae bacterium]|nr:Holliday junction resolvase RuvX [Candidatus Limimonas coprohippi]
VILGVDYGYARTGLAVCDETEFLCSPIGVIKESYMPKVAKQVAQVAAERKAKLVVVGLPLNMDGTKGEHALASEELAEILKGEYGLDVALQDERLTTVEAYNLLNESGTYGKKRRAVVDQVAATIILEDYIKTARKNGD